MKSLIRKELPGRYTIIPEYREPIVKLETTKEGYVVAFIVFWALLIFTLGFSVWAIVHSSPTGLFSYFIVGLLAGVVIVM